MFGFYHCGAIALIFLTLSFPPLSHGETVHRSVGWGSYYLDDVAVKLQSHVRIQGTQPDQNFWRGFYIIKANVHVLKSTSCVPKTGTKKSEIKYVHTTYLGSHTWIWRSDETFAAFQWMTFDAIALLLAPVNGLKPCQPTKKNKCYN